MRRRTPLNMWPSIADLMTVLAVPAVICAVGFIPFLANSTGYAKESTNPLDAINPNLSQAMAEVEGLMQDLARVIGVGMEDGQVLRFGDDFVDFNINSVKSSLAEGKEGAFRRYCMRLAVWFDANRVLAQNIVIFVEGHTDDKDCSRGTNDQCNWDISGRRATGFINLMRDEQQCPGGSSLPLRGLAMATTRPVLDALGQIDGRASRRIEIRIEPDYEALVKVGKSKV